MNGDEEWEDDVAMEKGIKFNNYINNKVAVAKTKLKESDKKIKHINHDFSVCNIPPAVVNLRKNKEIRKHKKNDQKDKFTLESYKIQSKL